MIKAKTGKIIILQARRTSLNKSIFFGSAVLATCFLIYVFGPTPPFWIQSKIKERLASMVFDADSVQLKDLSYSKNKSEYICGFLNAKNLYGAYVGFTRFAYSMEYNELYMVGHDLTTDYVIKNSGCFNQSQ